VVTRLLLAQQAGCVPAVPASLHDCHYCCCCVSGGALSHAARYGAWCRCVQGEEGATVYSIWMPLLCCPWTE
jgi:hypothetical protein